MLKILRLVTVCLLIFSMLVLEVMGSIRHGVAVQLIVLLQNPPCDMYRRNLICIKLQFIAVGMKLHIMLWFIVVNCYLERPFLFTELLGQVD